MQNAPRWDEMGQMGGEKVRGGGGGESRSEKVRYKDRS